MDIKQIYEFVNDAVKESIGETAILNEDLTNITDIGSAVFDGNAVDSYVKALVNRIGKTIFVDRIYKGDGLNINKSDWEFGSVLQKIRGGLPQAQENESWQLEDGASYDCQVFVKPNVQAKYYNSKSTFEVQLSITELQVKQSFTSPYELNAFVSMLMNKVESRMNLDTENLSKRIVNRMIAETIHDEYGTSSRSTSSKTRAVNLLYLYNTEFNATLTTSDALETPSFVRFASKMIKLISKRFKAMTKLYNDGTIETHTPKDNQKIALHDEFQTSADVYLQSDVFHNELTALPNADSVAYWQGTGTDWTASRKINVTLENGVSVEQDNILGVLFDEDACMVCNHNRRTTSNYVAKAEFTNYYFKYDISLFGDKASNFVVLFMA